MRTNLSTKSILHENSHSSLQDCALKTPNAAEFLGLSPKTLQNWRVMGIGPAFQKGPGIRGSIRYPISSLNEWRDQHLQFSTSQNRGEKA
jgi:hypothetical protein